MKGLGHGLAERHHSAWIASALIEGAHRPARRVAHSNALVGYRRPPRRRDNRQAVRQSHSGNRRSESDGDDSRNAHLSEAPDRIVAHSALLSVRCRHSWSRAGTGLRTVGLAIGSGTTRATVLRSCHHGLDPVLITLTRRPNQHKTLSAGLGCESVAPAHRLPRQSGSDSEWNGIVWAPGGLIEMSGSMNETTLEGTLIGWAVRLNGSNLTIAYQADLFEGDLLDPDGRLGHRETPRRGGCHGTKHTTPQHPPLQPGSGLARVWLLKQRPGGS